jgi:hypothetical protein
MRSSISLGVVLLSVALPAAAVAGERFPGSLALDTEVALDPGWFYPSAGVGAAERLGATLYVKRFNMDGGMGQFWIDVGLAAEFFHYADCYDSTVGGCSANVVFVPVGFRFGVGATKGWRFVLDLGAGPFVGFLPDVCGASCPPGGAPSTEGFFPAVSLGAEASVGRHVSMSFGLGIPTFYLGVALL